MDSITTGGPVKLNLAGRPRSFDTDVTDIAEYRHKRADVQETQLVGLPQALPYDDDGAAQRFAATHESSLRYYRGEWYEWAGGRWHHDPDGQVNITNRVIRLGDAIAREPDGDPQGLKRRVALCKRVGTLSGANAVLTCAEGYLRAKREFDAPETTELLNCENGLLDLRTGELKPHDPEALITHLAPVLYDPEATAPRFLDMLSFHTGGDAELMAYFARCAGLWLTGAGHKHFFFLQGPRHTCKTTFVQAVVSVLGSELSKAPLNSKILERQAHGTHTADLIGMRLAVLPEVERALPAERLKSLTGNEGVTADRKYKENVSARQTWHIVLSSNRWPHIPADDEAMWDRLVLLPFKNTRGEHARNDAVANAILTEERAGVLNWALAGYHDYLARGRLDPPESVRRAVEDYKVRCTDELTFQWQEDLREHLAKFPGGFGVATQPDGSVIKRDLRSVERDDSDRPVALTVDNLWEIFAVDERFRNPEKLSKFMHGLGFKSVCERVSAPPRVGTASSRVARVYVPQEDCLLVEDLDLPVKTRDACMDLLRHFILQLPNEGVEVLERMYQSLAAIAMAEPIKLRQFCADVRSYHELLVKVRSDATSPTDDTEEFPE